MTLAFRSRADRSFVLLASDGPAAQAVTAFTSAGGWQPVHVRRPEHLRRQNDTAACHVGVVVLDEHSEFGPDEAEQALQGTPLEWIAVIPANAWCRPALASLLADLCIDFHTLPFDSQRLLHSLGHARGRGLLRKRATAAREEVDGRFGMIGTSAPMQALYRSMERIIRVDSPVMIGGESGTGKELAAQAIHRKSARSGGPFVPVNCGSIPSTLIQSQLFGHERGAFTGAHQRQLGSLEAAEGGTIFLDEIGDLPMEAQANLLRFLQESTVVRVGATQPRRIDVRVIAATHVDLLAATRSRSFREDLYYRLNVLTLHMPPLRDRLDDLSLLVTHVLDTHLLGVPSAVREISPEALEAMRGYHWPGNVRELVNRLHRAMVMCESRRISEADIDLRGSSSRGSRAATLAGARSHHEREVVLAALHRNRFNMAASARELGIARVTLYRLVERLAIDTARGRAVDRREAGNQ